MTIDQLRSLLAVTKHQSLRKAAATLNLSQPAISKQLKALQEELGAQFYKRSGNGIELTEEGRNAAAHLAPLIKQLDDFEAAFQSRNPFAPKSTQLNVAATFSLVTNVLPGLIARFERAHPGIEWRCEAGSSETVQRMVSDGRVELAVTTYHPLTPDLISEPFRVQNLVFFVRRGHPLAARRRLTLKDVLAYPLVIRSVRGGPTATHDILRELINLGLKYKIAMRCSGPLIIKQAVAQNIGVGMTHLENLQTTADKKTFVVIKGADFRFLTLSYIIMSKERALSPLAQQLLATLRQAKRLPKGRRIADFARAKNRRLVTLNRRVHYAGGEHLAAAGADQSLSD